MDARPLGFPYQPKSTPRNTAVLNVLMSDPSVLLGRRQRFGLASRRNYLVIDLRKVNHASPHRLDLRIHPYAQHVGSTN